MSYANMWKRILRRAAAIIAFPALGIFREFGVFKKLGEINPYIEFLH